MMKKLISEPLTHFLIIGALFFIVFEVLQDNKITSETQIVITKNDIDMLKANFQRTWRRLPTQKELDGLLQEQIRDEIAYREALAMGLDQNDAYIKRRLRMKLELMLEGIEESILPTEQDLLEYLEQNRDMFRIEPIIGFSHVYLNSDKRKSELESDIENLLKRLKQPGISIELKNMGDPIMLPDTIRLSPCSDVDAQFGKGFCRKIANFEIGQWQGPVFSSFGYHLVKVHKKLPGRDPELSEVRSAVERELAAKRKDDLKRNVYSKLQERYNVIIDKGVGG